MNTITKMYKERREDLVNNFDAIKPDTLKNQIKYQKSDILAVLDVIDEYVKADPLMYNDTINNFLNFTKEAREEIGREV